MAPPLDDAADLVIRIAQILDTGYALDVTLSPAALQLPQGDDAVVTGDVRIRGQCTKMAEQIYFQGHISGVVATPCSRCLETVQADFMAETRVVFLPPTSDVPSEQEDGMRTTDELDLYAHDGSRLDLRPLVREQVVLSFPLQQLCHDDCAGLCQVCGANRNVTVCTCEQDDIAPRFAALRQLRQPKSS